MTEAKSARPIEEVVAAQMHMPKGCANKRELQLQVYREGCGGEISIEVISHGDLLSYLNSERSAQPQLPPRPWDMPTDDKDVYELIASKAPEERTLIDNLFKKYADVAFQAIANCDEMRRCLKHVEAENESLKLKQSLAKGMGANGPALLEQMRVENESLKATNRKLNRDNQSFLKKKIRDSHANTWLPYWRSCRRWLQRNDAEISVLKAERDKILEVIREYREGRGHKDCITFVTTLADDRCPTCIKADALLNKPEDGFRG